MSEPGDEERPDIQKKVFGRWISAKLPAHRQNCITDLYFDLQDGVVLLELISALTRREVKHEQVNYHLNRESLFGLNCQPFQGNLRVQKLRNVDNALNVLREERVKLSENVSAAAIVDGEAGSILSLCWSIIVHWQFYKVLQQSSSTSFNTLENLILKWCQQATADTTSSELSNFTRQLADGLVLCHIFLHYKPNFFDLETIKSKSPRERLELVFRAMESHYGVARILDPEDVHTLASDKKAVMTYLMCMFEAFPHDLSDLYEDGVSVVETVTLGSPLKGRTNLRTGTPGFLFWLRTFRGKIHKMRTEECCLVTVFISTLQLPN